MASDFEKESNFIASMQRLWHKNTRVFDKAVAACEEGGDPNKSIKLSPQRQCEIIEGMNADGSYQKFLRDRDYNRFVRNKNRFKGALEKLEKRQPGTLEGLATVCEQGRDPGQSGKLNQYHECEVIESLAPGPHQGDNEGPSSYNL